MKLRKKTRDTVIHINYLASPYLSHKAIRFLRVKPRPVYRVYKTLFPPLPVIQQHHTQKHPSCPVIYKTITQNPVINHHPPKNKKAKGIEKRERMLTPYPIRITKPPTLPKQINTIEVNQPPNPPTPTVLLTTK